MSNLGTYVGARLLTDWMVSLNVLGAEESPDYEYDQQTFNVSLKEALGKLAEYQQIIDDNYLDAYLSISAMRYDEHFEGDIERICEDLLNFGIICESEYESTLESVGHYYYS